MLAWVSELARRCWPGSRSWPGGAGLGLGGAAFPGLGAAGPGLGAAQEVLAWVSLKRVSPPFPATVPSVKPTHANVDALPSRVPFWQTITAMSQSGFLSKRRPVHATPRGLGGRGSAHDAPLPRPVAVGADAACLLYR